MVTPGLNENELEALDTERVNQSLSAIRAKDFATAEDLLSQVCANTPSDYTNSFQEADGTLVIKFWDKAAFLHYVSWPPPTGCGCNVRWILNAYPRAHYYLGFACVALSKPEQALQFLERGRELEPTNPHFNFEMAHAFIRMKQPENALAFYDAISEISPYVSRLNLAVAKRGRGSALIALERLDEAEEAFRESLDCEPGNRLALNELIYISELKMGCKATPGMTHVTDSKRKVTSHPNPQKCAVCGAVSSQGTAVGIQGATQFVCHTCRQSFKKKWWQFWK